MDDQTVLLLNEVVKNAEMGKKYRHSAFGHH